MPHLLVAVVMIAGVWLLLRRANELCLLRVEAGKCRIIRGRAPSRLVEDVEEIARHADLAEVTLRVVVEAGTPRASMSDSVSEGVQQRIRNAVGQHRIVHFRTGRAAR